MPSDITYEWVLRRPAKNGQDDNICQWIFHLRASRGEASSYISETVTITGSQKPIEEYTSEEVSKMAEAYRRVNKWDDLLKSDIEGQENAPRLVDGWNEDNLTVDS
tara:strand:- start:169 stop:486 length:318 start_codon:yes stop_codon:yes gene_type:complete